jgi:hypothetical protein
MAMRRLSGKGHLGDLLHLRRLRRRRSHFGRHFVSEDDLRRVSLTYAFQVLCLEPRPILSLAPASFELPSCVALAALHRSSFENS